MKNIKALFTKNSIPLFVVIVFGVLAARSLVFQSGYFMMHDDLQMMRQLEMEKCFMDWQIPCRWVPDMGYGYGFPLFNFYPPLPYFVGQVIRFLGFSFANTVKLNFALSLVASGIAMYFLAKEFFGRAGAILSSVFYVWAPYHAVEVYVRGAMNENWALVFFPLIFLFSYKLVRSDKDNKMWIIALSISWFGLLTSHNLMVMIFTPFFALWVLALFVLYKVKRLPHLLISGIWALGLAAFFTVPALTENGLTHLRSQLSGYFEYSAHFVTLKQLLISRYWGYEGSAWGTDNDGMSFAIGHLHWILSLLIGFVVFVKLLLVKLEGLKNRKLLFELRKRPILITAGYLFTIGWMASFLTHSRSTPVYLLISQLQYIQFPWRFLTIVIFAFSFLVGIIPSVFVRFKKIKVPIVGFLLQIFGSISQSVVVTLLIVVLVVMNWNYFKPRGGKMGPMTDEGKFSGIAWEMQQAAGTLDYLPIFAKTVPRDFRSSVADVIEGSADIYNSSNGTYWSSFRVDVVEDAVIRINTTYFPNWKVYLKQGSNSQEISTYIPGEESWGRIWIDLPKGEYMVYAQIFNTPVRTWSNIISLVSWTALVLVVFRKKINLDLFRQP